MTAVFAVILFTVVWLEQSKHIFRPEVIETSSQRLGGEVMLAMPLSWRLISWLLGATVFTALTFILMTKIPTVQSEAGTVVLDTGVVNVTVLRDGIIDAIGITDGQWVNKDQALITVRAEDGSAGSISIYEDEKRSLLSQIGQSQLKISELISAKKASDQSSKEQMQGIRADISSLYRQIDGQTQLLQSAEQTLKEIRPVAERGFISKTELHSREDTVLNRRLSLEQLKQTVGEKTSQLASMLAEASKARSDAETQLADARAAQAQVERTLAQSSQDHAFVVRAPIAGRVTSFGLHVGGYVGASGTILQLIPKGAQNEIELRISASSGGAIAPGQDVRVAVEAFPYQQFGFLQGSIKSVADAASTDGGAQAPDTSGTFLVRVKIKPLPPSAPLSRVRLKPGMAITARIVTSRRALLDLLWSSLSGAM